ncbi:Hsp20/alpha crystallin family protein [Arthrobacter sp. ATA002]|uniref:Hsp20/alpha crystallin family protein n=1 Tax=Arthrobacter sp. ATA002 TaxID=2991715 RepID=UPI0022A76317|nr:Hsp20/alpha crystallin family protein [Arthrobacter sp. ATA002]WAP53123.1 Hsp20/alpha crystallin family protein [Arthrobacter sp. ATA002]
MVFRFDPAPGLDLPGPQLSGSQGAADTSGIPVDLYREGDHYILNADLPGLDPGSLYVGVEGRLLTLRGYRTLRDAAEPDWQVRDRRRGLLQRQVLLGPEIDTAKISAQCTCGVLSVFLPVDPARRRRKIEVRPPQ